MKLAKIIAAAGLAAAAVTMSTSANAQDYGRHRGWDNHDRGYDRGDHRGWDRGRHHGWNNRWNRHHRVCRTEWRHHRRVTVCYR